MVGLSGLEPPTSRLSGVRSNRLSYKPIIKWFSAFIRGSKEPFSLQKMPLTASFCGGDERDRTADPLLARQVLSQLS